MMNLCPCLQELITKFTKKKGELAYERATESEEEEFINPQHGEDNLLRETLQKPHEVAVDQITTKAEKEKSVEQPEVKQIKLKELPQYFEEEEVPQHHKQEDLLDVKVELQSAPQEDNIEDLIRYQLNLAPPQPSPSIQPQLVQPEVQVQQAQSEPEPQVQQPISEPEPLELSEQINFSSFAINIDTLDPYFAILHEKTSRLPELFKKEGVQLEIGFPNKTDLSINQIGNGPTSCFLIRYRLHSEFSYYLSVMKNDKLHQTFNSLISESRVLEALRPNLTRNTLKFKRIGSFEARDCYYVKYQNGVKRQHWEICLNDDKAVRVAEFKNCDVFSAKNFRQINNRNLQVTQYLEVDLQSNNVASIQGKLIVEFRNYLNSLQDYLEKNYEQELA